MGVAFVDGKVAGTAVVEEVGRNPKGYKSRTGEYQEVIYMLLEL